MSLIEGMRRLITSRSLGSAVGRERRGCLSTVISSDGELLLSSQFLKVSELFSSS